MTKHSTFSLPKSPPQPGMSSVPSSSSIFSILVLPYPLPKAAPLGNSSNSAEVCVSALPRSLYRFLPPSLLELLPWGFHLPHSSLDHYPSHCSFDVSVFLCGSYYLALSPGPIWVGDCWVFFFCFVLAWFCHTSHWKDGFSSVLSLLSCPDSAVPGT